MLELSRGRMTKSGVVDIATGGSTTSDIRTSTGTFISRKRDDVIARIEKRIELWSHVRRRTASRFKCCDTSTVKSIRRTLITFSQIGDAK